MDDWTVPQILDLAPDASGRKAGQALGKPGLWQALGCDGALAWGEIKGSGAAPYRSALDLQGPVFRCSCPSRKFPCKHGLGLFLVLAEGAVAAGTQPDWVAEWAAKRASAQKPASKAAPDEPAKDPKAQERRRQGREAKVSAGVEELDLWMRDLVRRGLAGARSEPFAFWDRMGARLVDAQAQGLARRVRALPGLLAAGADGDAVAALGRLHLLTQGWRNQEVLGNALREELRTAIGFTASENLAAVEDHWTVLAQVTTEEDKLLVRSTWLASVGGRVAQVLDFAAGGRPFVPAPGPGYAFRGALEFHPGAAGLRAVLQSGEVAPPAPFAGGQGIGGALSAVADALARVPWLEQWPMLLRGVRFARRGDGFAVMDAGGALPLAANPEPVPFLSVAGGAAVNLFGLWDGQALQALALGHAGRLYIPPGASGAYLRRAA